jgi:hypothetical protein
LVKTGKKIEAEPKGDYILYEQKFEDKPYEVFKYDFKTQ